MKKVRLLKLIDILIKHTDINHPISLKEIFSYLNEENIKCERKALYDDIKILKNAGYAICSIKEKDTKYYLKSTNLNKLECKIILDSLSSMNFFPKDNIDKITEKLLKNLSIYQRKELLGNIIPYNPTNVNHDFLKNLELLQYAIDHDLYVSFKYFDINLNNKKQYRKQSKFYQLSPYGLVLIQQKYYCIFYSDHYQSFTNYRVDKIDDLKVTNLIFLKIPFDINDYLNKSFNMYSTNRESITVEFNNEVFGTVYEKLKDNMIITKKNENSFVVNINIAISNSFFSWLMQFHDNAKIIAPKSIIEQFKQYLKTLLLIYQETA